MNGPELSRPSIPPPGPTLSFRQWTQALHRHILEYVANVDAAGTSKGVTITYRPPLEPHAVHTLGELANPIDTALTVRITPAGSTWYVNFERGVRFSMPPLAISRHDSFTAHVTAETIVGFLDPKLSTPDKKRLAPAPPKPT